MAETNGELQRAPDMLWKYLKEISMRELAKETMVFILLMLGGGSMFLLLFALVGS